MKGFSNSRKFDNFAFSFGTLAMENIFSNKNNFIRNFTSRSLNLVNRSKKLKKFFIEKATGKIYFKNY